MTAGVASAQDLQEIALKNWTAAPYLASTYVAPDASKDRGGRQALALSSGRQALAAAPPALPFVAVTPCRVADTRLGSGFAGDYGMPAIQAQSLRSFVIGEQCSIPATAQAVSFMFTVINETEAGNFRAFPTGTAMPTVGGAVLVWSATTGAITNSAAVPVGGNPGSLDILMNGALGSTADLIIDVNGYYSPQGIVNSLNGLGGDLTFSAGTNVTITPSGNTFTINSSGVTGAAGPAGPLGLTGPAGANGIQGIPGLQGLTGAQGIPGIPGATGAQGLPGSFESACLISATDFFQLRDCLLTPAATLVFNSFPSPMTPSVPSQAFQAQQAAEFGDEITLAGTARKGVSATMLMVTWAPRAEYPLLSAAGYSHPITLNIYSDAIHARAHTPDIGTVTQAFLIPWRPIADPTCAVPTKWRASDGSCNNGFAFPIVFNLGGVVLPDTFIYGIAYDTNTWGYTPIGVGGPYESLNVGLNTTTFPNTVGTDNNPDAVYFNTKTAAWYADGGADGIGIFRLDTAWTGYTPAVKFTTVN
jgi:hypothetical protein